MIKFRALSATAAILTLAAVGVALQPPAGQPPAGGAPQPGQPGQPDQRRGPGGPEGRPAGVDGSMKAMNRALRQLKNQIGDASKRDENLRLVNDAERGCVGAKGSPLPPRVLRDAVTDADKAKLADTFRNDLITLMRNLLELEEAIAAGKTDAGKTKLDEVLKLRATGHDAMGVRDRDD
jgi:hypothetical protein